MKYKLYFLLFASLSLVVLSGCDTGLHAQGVVYEWLNPTPGSKWVIYVNSTLPSDAAYKPLSGVKVSFGDERLAGSTLTDSSGYFLYDKVIPAGNMTL